MPSVIHSKALNRDEERATEEQRGLVQTATELFALNEKQAILSRTPVLSDRTLRVRKGFRVVLTAVYSRSISRRVTREMEWN